jgi:hypothetical protein
MKSGFSRRTLLKGLGVGAGAVIGSRLAGGASGLIGEARADITTSAVVIVHLDGGFNALFVSPASFQPAGTFGVSAGNFTALGNNVTIDNTWNTALSAWAKQHLAVLGVRHGQSGHDSATRADWTFNNSNAGLLLANAIGGTASIKAAVMGGSLTPGGGAVPLAPVAGTSFQQINDLQSTIDAFGGSIGDTRKPTRNVALPTMTGAKTMAGSQLTKNPGSLGSLGLGYTAAIDTIQKTAPALTFAEFATAYGLGTTTGVGSLKSKFAAAELMIRTGTNVVAIVDGAGWDSHGDTTGNGMRNLMATHVLSPLATFINRMVDPAQNPTTNVTLMIMGDFSRSLPGSDHQPNLSVGVFGRHVQLGSTGNVAADVSLPNGSPSVPGMWAYLAAASQVATNPFGANPHGLLI